MSVFSKSFFKYLLYIPIIISVGCSTDGLKKNIDNADEKIIEISISTHNGLGGVGTKIFLKSDGNAKIICSYQGNSADWKPFDSDGICEKLFFQTNKPLDKKPTQSNFSREETYSDKVFPEDFEKVSSLILKNDFFSMKDKYTDDQILTDSPPVITTVVSSKRTKEVINYRSFGGQKLSEIEQAIFETGGKIKSNK